MSPTLRPRRTVGVEVPVQFLTRFMQVTAHPLHCALVIDGPACSCGQTAALRAVRQEVAKWLESTRS